MTTTRALTVPTDDLRRGLRWSAASVTWTMVASTTTIAAGLAADSLLLVAFGAVGAVDLIGSVVLFVHFRHALRHVAIHEARERVALLVIATAMGVIAAGTIALSALHLAHHTVARTSTLGTVVAGASVVTLTVLARGKIGVGRVVSRALVADGHLSIVGALLAAVACVGTIATSVFNWWWLDAVGSIAIALVAAVVAIDHARHA
jgi:divalent metal cation (Fe/Co/Zn/Cd) transporter